MNISNSTKIKRLVGIATLCAITFVLQFVVSGVMPKLPLGGGTAVNLALIPVVLAAILYGPLGGLTVGLFLGATTLLPGQGAEVFYVNWYMTLLAIFLCLLKAGLAGFVAGLLFKLLRKKTYVGAIFAAAAITPIVNTGIFLLLYGVLIYIMTGEAYSSTFVVVGAAVWLVFLVEFLVNVVVSPALASIIKVLAKNYDLGFVDDVTEIVGNKVDDSVFDEIVED